MWFVCWQHPVIAFLVVRGRCYSTLAGAELELRAFYEEHPYWVLTNLSRYWLEHETTGVRVSLATLLDLQPWIDPDDGSSSAASSSAAGLA